ncbi:EXLDI protein [Actinoplanes sp. NEAU-A12]|uniref:EXLDI protein n=1 Tax=Actinoplanes sandaracinus TaxID=3045177 RepID=A0ABT6X1P5_9ACTN|nr:EXLDI protein [Actinoplanes sandaracinus]MDI6105909.1 EXLDI protein [Actinoplanes sandaracinus]
MPNKTIYIADDDLPLLQQAQELTGGNLSGAIVTALRRLVELEQAKRSGFDEITVKVGLGNSSIKRFLGVALGEWTTSGNEGDETYSLFRTSKGRFAVHHSHSELHTPVGPNAEHSRKWSTGWRGWVGDWSPDQAWMRTPAQAVFTVVDTAEELEPLLPAELYALALRTIRDEPSVEDLDI